MSHLELEVLACLAASPGVVWSHEELHEAAWGTRYVGDRDSVYSLVKRLRRKLAERGVALDLVAVRGRRVPAGAPPGVRARALDTPSARALAGRPRARLTAGQSTSSGMRISTGVSDPCRPTSRSS